MRTAEAREAINRAWAARWYPLRPHPIQQQLWRTNARFVVVPAGRRSGKTEIAKRRGVRKAVTHTRWPDAKIIFAAPTQRQVKRIYWSDLKALVPPHMVKRVYESELSIKLVNGAEIICVGMDEPARIEGMPIDHITLDEYGNMKEEVWPQNVRPAVDTPDRQGTAWLIGVPEGRNHYYKTYVHALDPAHTDWAVFEWTTAEINPVAAAAAREELDAITYAQEYEGRFVTFGGAAYYAFDPDIHVGPVAYTPNEPVFLCFDFNVEPGVAVIAQELPTPPNWLDSAYWPEKDPVVVALDEVWIERGSNTERVTDEIIRRWRGHRGAFYLYGDASGGARSSKGVQGSDWDIIARKLRRAFGDRVFRRVPMANPRERQRVNSVNARFMSVDKKVRALVHPSCKNLQRDLEGVSTNPDGTIEKKKGSFLTHISDAWGYMCHRRYPVADVSIHSHELA